VKGRCNEVFGQNYTPSFGLGNDGVILRTWEVLGMWELGRNIPICGGAGWEKQETLPSLTMTICKVEKATKRPNCDHFGANYYPDINFT